MSALGRRALLLPCADTAGVALPVVFVDVDEVLFPFAHAYDRWLRKNVGHGLDYSHLAQYDVEAAAGPDHDRLVVQFHADPSVVHTEKVIPPAGKLLAQLSGKYKIVACTSRFEHDEGTATRNWLHANAPQVADVIFTRFRRGETPKPKADFVTKHNAVLLIDDYAKNLVGLPPSCHGLLTVRPAGLPSGEGALQWAEIFQILKNAHML